MAKRKTLSKRLRFEVFKRDAFTCVYCGRTPPGVVLELDHVTPLFEGGSDEDSNLVTSCDACNRGKGAIPLDTSAKAKMARAALDRQREADEQVEAYDAYLTARRAKRDAFVREFIEAWGEYAGGWHPAGPSIDSINRFWELLPPAELYEAFAIALRKIGAPTWDEKWSEHGSKAARERQKASSLFRYFCGVCWKRINGRIEVDP